MLNPWLILGIVIAWLASLWGVGSWQREDGRTAERAAWEAREAQSMRDANATIQRLTREARDLEASHQQRLADIAANMQKETARHEADRDRAVSGATALVLRDQPACPGGAGGGAPGAPGAGPGGGDGPAACELPHEAVRDLLALVLDADRDVRQLAHAQAVIEEDRRVCGADPAKGTP
jgi:hypothetical protein